MPVGGRTAGKYGAGGNSYYSGHSYKSINDEIIWVSIGMGILIILLITIALCYIAYEKCHKKPRDQKDGDDDATGVDDDANKRNAT